MQTRVKPGNGIYSWWVEVLDPYTDKWTHISSHDFFWYANMKANYLSKKSLTIKKNAKEEFIDRLKGTHKEPSKAAIGCPP